MCGACGRTAVSDPALGPVRTMRQHAAVAQAVNGVCQRLPGAPRVTALSDGWLLAGATGSARLCHTVEELWVTIIDGSFRSDTQLDGLLEAQSAYSADPANAGLSARIVELGRTLGENARSRRGGS